MPYGSWQSPISSQMIVSDAVSLDEIRLSDNACYHIERRPQEQGRCVIVKTVENTSRDILPPPYSARSRVHEYGGGVYCLDNINDSSDNNRVFFVNDSDQDIYSISEGDVTRITQNNLIRFADLIFDPYRQCIIAVAEQHKIQENAPEEQREDHSEPENSIVCINITSGHIKTLYSGEDFYASPRLNHNGKHLCWLSWNHPNMPWDGNELWLADIDDTGDIQQAKHIQGLQEKTLNSDNSISICQPCWSPDDKLYFISDVDNWWHIYRHENNQDATPITQGNFEIGLPAWVFAQSSYAFINADTILSYPLSGHGENNPQVNDCQLSFINVNDPTDITIIETPWDSFSSLSANKYQLAFIGAAGLKFPAIVQTHLSAEHDNKNLQIDEKSSIKTSMHLDVSTEFFSQAKSLSFNNRYQQTIHANYYPPTNPQYLANENELPPLIVICHGGPTGCSDASLDPKKQFWTSRGFALLDVNYSGSTGYGRDYRRRLNTNWGVLDVEDCCDGALYAVKKGLADKNRLIIRGSSAGGYTVLCALTYHDVFSAGASYYGISELETLATDTHKFESRYLDRLIGPYPEEKLLYQQRSPIHHYEQLNCPVIFFQGIEDKVVPKEQAEKMIEALDKKGIAVASRFFAGEQHGFRQAKTITETLENELYFYSKIFGFKTTDGLSIPIMNIDHKL